MKKILFLLFVAISIISCSKNKEDEEIIDNIYTNVGHSYIGEEKDYDFNGSFMEGFFTPTILLLKDIKYDSFRGISIRLYTDIDSFYPEILYQIDMSEQKKLIYNEYVKFYGDTLYSLAHNKGTGYYGCKFPVDNISIVTDKDFDNNHIAGQELNDLFILRPDYAFMDYIQSDYDIEYSYCMAKDYPLQDVSDFKLLSEKSILLLTPRPSTPGDYTFTVTINFLPDPVSGEECESLVQTVIMKF